MQLFPSYSYSTLSTNLCSALKRCSRTRATARNTGPIHATLTLQHVRSLCNVGALGFTSNSSISWQHGHEILRSLSLFIASSLPLSFNPCLNLRRCLSLSLKQPYFIVQVPNSPADRGTLKGKIGKRGKPPDTSAKTKCARSLAAERVERVEVRVPTNPSKFRASKPLEREQKKYNFESTGSFRNQWQRNDTCPVYRGFRLAENARRFCSGATTSREIKEHVRPVRLLVARSAHEVDSSVSEFHFTDCVCTCC